MTSSYGNIFCATGPLWGETTGGFPSQRPVTRSCDVSLMCLNKRLSKQSRCRLFEKPSRSLWLHCNEIVMKCRYLQHHSWSDSLPHRKVHLPLPGLWRHCVIFVDEIITGPRGFVMQWLWWYGSTDCRVGCFVVHDDVMKCKHFPCFWPFEWGIDRSPVNSPHKGQWRGAWTNGWVNNRDAGDLRRHRARYDVTIMIEGDKAVKPI